MTDLTRNSFRESLRTLSGPLIPCLRPVANGDTFGMRESLVVPISQSTAKALVTIAGKRREEETTREEKKGRGETKRRESGEGDSLVFYLVSENRFGPAPDPTQSPFVTQLQRPECVFEIDREVQNLDANGLCTNPHQHNFHFSDHLAFDFKYDANNEPWFR